MFSDVILKVPSPCRDIIQITSSSIVLLLWARGRARGRARARYSTITTVHN